MREITFSLFIFILLVSGNISADNWPVGSRSAGMGNASVTLRDIWSIHHNQAGLAYLQHPTAGFHFENRFLVPEMGLRAGAFAYPTKLGSFGLSLSYLGYSKYNESKIGICYARTFGKNFSAGIQFDYLNTYFEPEYGNKGTAVAEIGLLSQPVKNLYIGAHVYNPTRSRFADYNDERVPTIIRFGIGYNLSDKVYIAAEAEKDLDFDPLFKAGAEYFFLKNMYLYAGVSASPASPSFGIGYMLKGFRADLSFSSHPELGITPHFSLIYEFGKKSADPESHL